MKKDKTRLALYEGWISICINSLLFILKYWVGISTGSVAIIADAWHTLSDSLTSIVVIIGIKVSAKPADKDHPFGHGRAELIASIAIGMFLAIVGLNFFLESITKFRNQEPAVFGVMASTIFVLSIILKEGIAQFSFWAYRKTGLQSLKADGWHHRSDSIASFLILVGIYLGKYFWWIDSILGIIVAALIIFTAYKIITEAAQPLLGDNVDEELKKQLAIIFDALNLKEFNIHHLHKHKYGDHAEITFHINLPKNMELQKVHEIVDNIERRIKTELFLDATIHVEPLRES